MHATDVIKLQNIVSVNLVEGTARVIVAEINLFKYIKKNGQQRKGYVVNITIDSPRLSSFYVCARGSALV